MSKPAAADAAQATAKPSLIARLRGLPTWVREHRIKAAIGVSAVFSVIGASLFTWAVFEAKRQQAEKEHSYTTADALKALSDNDLAEALHIAKLVKLHNNVTTEDAGGPAFVFGYAAWQKAENPYDINRHHAYKIAAYWFEEAWRNGVPEDHRPLAAYLCGKTLTEAERYVDALPMLAEALRLNPDKAGEISGYMAEALFLQPDPNLPAALAASDAFLNSTEGDEEQRVDGHLLRAELYLLLDRGLDGEPDLKVIPNDSRRYSEVLILRARRLLAEAIALRKAENAAVDAAPIAARDRLLESLQLLDDAIARDSGLTSATPRASYVAGLVELERGRIDAADEHFQQAYRRSIDGPIGIAAQLKSAYVARRQDRYDAAVELYRDVLDDVGNPRTYSNRWVPLTPLKQALLDAYDDFFHKREFAAGSTLAELFIRLFDEDHAVQLAAESNVAWGQALAEAAMTDSHDADHDAEASRRRFRTAGRLYERLAELRQATSEYPEEIWASAQNYLRGAAYDDASRQFRLYLEVEPRGRHADAMIGLAEVMFVKQRHEQALTLLHECLDLHPRDPSQFRARLLLANLLTELNQWEEAETVLRENLESDALTPQSEEWRRSLFTLGRLLYDVGRYDEAAERLDEAVARYPEDAETTDTRYRAAESHRRIAQQIELEVPTDSLPAERAKFVRRAETEYLAALERFDETIRVARSSRLRAVDEADRHSLLRNALFARGSILQAINKYDEAIRAHQTAIAAFPNSPAALDAYLQIVDCYRRLGRRPEARGTLEQARLMLNRLPQDTSFESVSNYTRQEWAKLLDTLGSL